jgi:hypothetical protein
VLVYLSAVHVALSIAAHAKVPGCFNKRSEQPARRNATRGGILLKNFEISQFVNQPD